MNTSSIPNRILTIAAAITVSLALSALNQAHGSVSYSTVGSAYSENFDTLPNSPENVNLQTYVPPSMWTDDTAAPPAGQFSIPGWYLYHPLLLTEGGVNGHQRVRIGAGTATTGGFMSWGASGSTERALGDLGSNVLAPVGGDIYLGLRLRNDTGVTLERFTLSYNGEQWRDGSAATPNAQTMSFMYSTTATAISDANSLFTAVPALDFTSPVFVATVSGVAVDGNAAGRVNGITATVGGFAWMPGTDLWLRWDDISHSGNDHGLGIDDLTFTATIPEPSSLLLVGLGIAALLVNRRR